MLEDPDGPELHELSLEELMDLKVTIASRREESIGSTPAAVYVITGDELRRSGHTSIQEALRMVPGFHVAQWKSSGWDVTARGFTGSLSNLNESFANQMLLMVDGVSLYSPVMAGIWWPLLDVPLEDVDRIEIVRGPGGALWGGNAVNGVVHVITKHSSETQGDSVSSHWSGWEWSADYVHGGRLEEDGTYRLWTSFSRYEPLESSTGETFPEDWRIASVGGRFDWDLGRRGRLRVLSTAYTSSFGEEPYDADIQDYAPFDDTPKNGGWLVGTWDFGSAEDSQRLQGWYSADHQKQSEFQQDVQSLDLEYSRTRRAGTRHTLTWGLGLRHVQSDLEGERGLIDFDPEFRRTYGARAFCQDQIDLPGLESRLILGAQLEDNSLIDLELQPNARWVWQPNHDNTLWASVARVVRTPSLEEVDLVQRFDSGGPPDFVGNPDFEPEEVLSHELGWRTRVGEHTSLDLTGFYNDYEHLQSVELDDDGSALTFGNEIVARAYGAELGIDVDVSSDWRIRAGYGYFEMDFRAHSGSFEELDADWRDAMIPEQRVNLRSYYDLSDEVELDLGLYWVDRSSTFFFENPAYWRVDARLGWRPTEDIRISVGVQNLTEDTHPEAGEDIDYFGGEVERRVFLSLSTRF